MNKGSGNTKVQKKPKPVVLQQKENEAEEAANLLEEGLHLPEISEADRLDIPSEEDQPGNEREALNAARHAKRLYDRANNRLSELENELAARKAALDSREALLVSRELQADSQSKLLNEKLSELNETDRIIAVKKIDMESGFALEQMERRQKFEEEMRIIREKLDSDRENWISENRNLKDRLLETYNSLEADLRADIEKERADLREKKAHLDKRRLELDQREDNIDTESLLAEGRARLKVIRELNQAVMERDHAKGQLDFLTERLDAQEAELRRLRTQERQFDGMSANQVVEQLRKYETENRRLREELESRPDADLARRYHDLQETYLKEQQEVQNARSERARLLKEAGDRRNEVTTLESLRDENRSLRAARETHEAALRELEATVDKYIQKNDTKEIFQASAGLDRNVRYQEKPELEHGSVDLKQFTDQMRLRMASFGNRADRRWYAVKDVRTFVAGLAMSRLHLLQGISGTGKTSLPQAFARALTPYQENYATIEVQAGWRDRADLLGTYNPFEGRFNESEFLKALYTARTDLHSDLPYFVILDEMNLSHPEQYFADFLSMLEQKEGERRVRLTGASDITRPIPAGFERDDHGGIFLPLPENVWFIGTANHDETTKDFADKTYDRSHIMELPTHPEPFKAVEFDRGYQPPDLRSLSNAFLDAQDHHEKEAGLCCDFLRTQFGDLLADRFDLSWGSRLEKQIRRFVPVFLASGGETGEALDHILATKLLRKLIGRFDYRENDLRELRDHLELCWMDDLVSGSDHPLSSMQLRRAFRAINADFQAAADTARA